MSRTPGAKDKRKRKAREDDHRPWENSPIYQDAVAEVPAEYNSRRIAFQREIFPVGDLPRNDPEKMVEMMGERFRHYLEMCDKYGMKIGNQAAYFALGIDKDIVWAWLNNSNTNPMVRGFIKKVQYFCSTYREGMMEDGKLNPVTGIFWQKNYDGMRDQQELVVAKNDPLGEKLDASTLQQKYLEMTEDQMMIEQKENKSVSDIIGSSDAEKLAERP